MSDVRKKPKPGEWRWATVNSNGERMLFLFDSTGGNHSRGFGDTIRYPGKCTRYYFDELTDISEPIVDPLAAVKNKKGKRP